MFKRYDSTCPRLTRLGLLVAGTILLMSACNLGPQAPSEPLETTPLPAPQDVGGEGQPEAGGPTATPQIEVPPTNTPEPELLPSEVLGPIAIDGDTHRTQEPVTVRLTAGTSVSTITCSWNHQDTGQQGTLGTPTTNQVNEDKTEYVYTFTPEMAGTYAVNCTGVALTQLGQRAVSAAGTPFTVEAKG